MPLCEKRNTKIIIGGLYSSGILATGAVAGARFNTKLAPKPILQRVHRIEAVCARYSVALPAAALQFPLGHPLVVSVIPGAQSVEELQRTSTIRGRQYRLCYGPICRVKALSTHLRRCHAAVEAKLNDPYRPRRSDASWATVACPTV
nr:aldo/keto reductase [Rhizobium tubonense]